MIRVSGDTHYSIGIKIANIYNKEKRKKPTLKKITNGKAKKIYDEMFNLYTTYYPEYIEELKGLADGLKINRERLIYTYLTIGEGKHCCSIVGYNGMIGRNYDWYVNCAKFMRLYNVSITGYNKFICIDDGGFPDGKNETYIYKYSQPIIGVDFFNDKFLYIGLLWMYFSEKTEMNGIFALDFMRKVAETCNNIDDVINLIKKIPIRNPKVFFIGDKTGRYIQIENYRIHEFKIFKPQNDLLIHTNNILNPKFRKYDDKWYSKESKRRYRAVVEGIYKIKPKTLMNMKTVMDDERIFSFYKGKPETIYQLFMNLKNREIFFMTKYRVSKISDLLL
jgi:predicted choloylglycine hydrolase